MDIIFAVLRVLSEPWVIVVLIASFMFAAGNYIDESLLTDYKQPVGTLVIISGLFGLVLASVFVVWAWFGSIALMVDPQIALKAVIVGIMEFLWIIPYLYATGRRGALVVGPLLQSVPVAALILEGMLGHFAPIGHIIAAMIIVSGGVLLSLETEEDEDGETSRSFDWITFGLMMISAILVAAIYVLFKDTTESANYVVVGFWSGLGMALSSVVAWVVYAPYRRDFNKFCRHADGKALGVQFFNECMDSGGAYLTHYANTIGPSVMMVTAFNASQPLFSLLIGIGLQLLGRGSGGVHRSPAQWATITSAIFLIALGVVGISLL